MEASWLTTLPDQRWSCSRTVRKNGPPHGAPANTKPPPPEPPESKNQPHGTTPNSHGTNAFFRAKGPISETHVPTIRGGNHDFERGNGQRDATRKCTPLVAEFTTGRCQERQLPTGNDEACLVIADEVPAWLVPVGHQLWYCGAVCVR